MRILPRTLFTLAATAAAALWLALGQQTDAQVGDTAVLVAVDTEVSGNGDNNVGPTEPCIGTAFEVGDSITVDVVVRAVPTYEILAANKQTGGVYQFQFRMNYDPEILHLEQFDFENTPNIVKTDGNQSHTRVASYGRDLQMRYDPEDPNDQIEIIVGDGRVDSFASGNGVLARLSFTAIGSGVSEFGLTDVSVGGAGGFYRVQTINGAAIVESGTCTAPLLVDVPSPTYATLPRQGGPPTRDESRDSRSLVLLLGGFGLAVAGFLAWRRFV